MMDWKKTLAVSTEVWTGAALVVAGAAALAAGMHGAVAQSLAPFGVGLILSDVLTRTARARRGGQAQGDE